MLSTSVLPLGNDSLCILSYAFQTKERTKAAATGGGGGGGGGLWIQAHCLWSTRSKQKRQTEEVTVGLLPPYDILHVMMWSASRIWISPEGWSLQKTCELLQHGANSPAKIYTSPQSPVKKCSLLTALSIVQKPETCIMKKTSKTILWICVFCFHAERVLQPQISKLWNRITKLPPPEIGRASCRERV